MNIVKPESGELKRAAEILRGGGIVIYPTDTLYGIGADATNDAAKERIFGVKGRESSKTFLACFSGIEQAREYVKVSNDARKIAEEFLPGPLTLVLPQRKELRFISKDGKIAVRIPDNEAALTLAKLLGRPITSTSANISGKKEPAAISDIDSEVMEKCDFVIDGGKCKYSKPSTILDVEERKILREGAVSRLQLQKLGFAD